MSDLRRATMESPQVLAAVHVSLDFLGGATRTRNRRPAGDTYALKHAIEGWARRRGRAVYVGEGCAIAACVYRGLMGAGTEPRGLGPVPIHAVSSAYIAMMAAE